MSDSKVTARIKQETYTKVKENFHHGQQTQFFRQVFESIEQLINSGEFDKVTDYLYKGTALTLPAREE